MKRPSPGFCKFWGPTLGTVCEPLVIERTWKITTFEIIFHSLRVTGHFDINSESHCIFL
ncbi:hypothetical protein M5D96_010835 [Drosophila gunungcola]|uniref:Uncharacterized protein n=1 Tax=Drosophila gunungcola TaxID=103775 RepID=A0A9Q0BKW4_9MUSC|nr:hypothetical protein M5D96_010835 [Drosophila gunungcola]